MHRLRCNPIKKFAPVFVLAFLACPGLLSATNYSCAGSGTRNWHTPTNWTPNGIPGAGDTATITAGCTMQCEPGNSCVVGKAGIPGTTDLNLQAGGNLTLLSGSTFDMRGDVSLLGELDIFGATFTLDPAAANGSAAYIIDGGASTGAVTLKICSEASCSSNSGSLAILTCKTGSSGSCQISHTSGQGNGMNVLGSHGQISNFGTATSPAVSLVDGSVPPTGGFVLKNGFSVHNNGVIRVAYESATANLTFDGVSFDSLVDKTGSSNGYSFLDLISLVAPTSGDRTFRATCASTGGHNAIVYIDVINPVVGDSTHPGWVSYNCMLFKGEHGGTFQNALSVIDRNYTSGTALATAYNADATYQNWVIYNHTPNQHHIVGSQVNGGGSGNTYNHITFDGDGYASYDAGDDYQDTGTYTASNGLHINASGTGFTLSSNPLQMASLDHETSYNTFGGALCESNCAATMFGKWSNSIFVRPSELYGAEFRGNDGMHADSAFSYMYRQTANSSATDYDVFWQMPGSGDPGAYPAKNTLIQLNLGATPSWIALPSPQTSIVSNQTPVITGGVDVFCSNCFQNAQAKDYVVDVTETPNTYAVIQRVTDSSHAVLYTAIPHYQSGDRIDVRPSYFVSNGLYGVDWGAHDQHMDPQFQDATRTVCTWWKLQTGSPANCNWANGNNYTATAGTSGTTIADSSVNFVALGVRDRVDQVLVYSAGWGAVKGSATVVGHSPHSLRVEGAINGAASGDLFTFVTAAESLGLSAVQLYGFDAFGNVVTPPSWVNTNMVQNIQSYLQQGYSPTNPALFNAGSDGKTVGAVEVMPPNGAIMVTSN